MQLELGKYYELRNGLVGEVNLQVNEPLYQFRVLVYNANGTLNRVGYYTQSGLYDLKRVSQFDVIQEIPKPPHIL